MLEDGDSLKFYIGEQVDSIISFRLQHEDMDEKIGLLTCNQTKGTVSFWEWDAYDSKLPSLIETLQLPNPISCFKLISTDLETTRFIVSQNIGISLYQVNQRKMEKVVGPVGHGNVLCFDVIRNGTQLLAAGEDGYLRFYSTFDLSLIRSIRASATSLHVARFATDTLIYCASSNKLEVWDLQKSTAEPILFLESKPKADAQLITNNSVFIWDICVHPDQPFICAAVDNMGYFSIWDLRKSKLAHQLFTASNNQESISEPIQYALYTAKIHEGNVLKASFIASYPNFIVTCGSDGSVMLLNLAPLELNSAYMEKLQTEKIVKMKKLLGRFSSISDFTVEGDIILTANDDESISVKTLQF